MTSLRLSELATHDHAVVEQVIDLRSPDPVAARLRDLGFVAGEPVRIAAKAPFGGDPLLIAIGTTRFALRRNEAERVLVTRAVNGAMNRTMTDATTAEKDATEDAGGKHA